MNRECDCPDFVIQCHHFSDGTGTRTVSSEDEGKLLDWERERNITSILEGRNLSRREINQVHQAVIARKTGELLHDL